MFCSSGTNTIIFFFQQQSNPLSVFDLLKNQMTEIAKSKKRGAGGGGGGGAANAVDTTNFMRQFRDNDSLELKKLSAAQFMEVWEHYDSDGEYKKRIPEHQMQQVLEYISIWLL